MNDPSPFPNPAAVPNLPPSPPHLYFRFIPSVLVAQVVMPLLIIGALISPVDQRSYDVLPSAFLYVGQDGLIKAIQEIVPPSAPITSEAIDAFLETASHSGELEILTLERGEFLIPGFVDTHTVRFRDHNTCAISPSTWAPGI